MTSIDLREARELELQARRVRDLLTNQVIVGCHMSKENGVKVLQLKLGSGQWLKFYEWTGTAGYELCTFPALKLDDNIIWLGD